jgi:hypothetical protein
MGYESREVIDQANFVETTEDLLGLAESGRINLEAARHNASEVCLKLAAIASGDLVVQPPLSVEQVEGFERRATIIGNLAAQGQEGIRQAESRARAQRQESSKPRRRKIFSGSGRSAKS